MNLHITPFPPVYSFGVIWALGIKKTFYLFRPIKENTFGSNIVWVSLVVGGGFLWMT